MGDVERAAGDVFSWRPLEPVPRVVQDANGHASINGFRAGQLRGWQQPILPGAREQGEIDRTAPVRRNTGEQRADQLMRVLADAAPLPQRGTIVDEYAHLCKSFRISILL